MGWRNFAGIMLEGIKKTENIACASCKLLSQVHKTNFGQRYLKKRAVYACASEFVGYDRSASAAQNKLYDGEERRDERLSEHAIAGEYQVRRVLSREREQKDVGMATRVMLTCKNAGTVSPPHVSGTTRMLPLPALYTSALASQLSF
jgi:hypothetical protein